MPDPCDECTEISCHGCGLLDENVEEYGDVISAYYNEDPEQNDQEAAAKADALATGFF